MFNDVSLEEVVCPALGVGVEIFACRGWGANYGGGVKKEEVGEGWGANNGGGEEKEDVGEGEGQMMEVVWKRKMLVRERGK